MKDLIAKRASSIGFAAALIVAGTAFAGEDDPCPGHQPGVEQLFWGDLHAHTSYSMDAYAGGTRNNPADAYAFARGAALPVSDGYNSLKLDRPLDFLAITDHAEQFGIMYLCAEPGYADTKYCRGLRHTSTDAGGFSAVMSYFAPLVLGTSLGPCEEVGFDCDGASKDLWQRVQGYANEFYSPCEFTTFIGYEWTAMPDLLHWHRNVIFSGNSVPDRVIDATSHPEVESLWAALDRECRSEDGCEAITIPHNGNLSLGGHFDIESETPSERRLRARYERLVEIYQQKGSSECLPGYGDDGTGDCDFELNISGHGVQARDENGKPMHSPEEWEKLRSGYVRSALLKGLLAYQAGDSEALNPLQLGIVASTDNHEGMPGSTEEDAWPAGSGVFDGKARRDRTDVDSWFERSGLDMASSVGTLQTLSPGGLVGVWAEENRRESIFAALKRRRTYGSSGTRIVVRFWQDWGESADACTGDAPVKPVSKMGGTFSEAPRESAKPRFIVQAAMDRRPLSRVDIVRAQRVGGSVVETVMTLPVDAPEGKEVLCIDWVDTAFEVGEPAFWYARVFEVPTPRWSRSICSEVECPADSGLDADIQERAWTSPIWYLP